MIFETIAKTGHEEVVFCHNKDAGLKAIIAIHNTVLGPALGGLRMWPYKTEGEAVNDVLRLSRGMTYKNAVAGLNIVKFLNYLREELTIVLATASSDAVLPQIMRKLERMGVKDSVVGLVLVLSVDWFIGMARALGNLIGNCVATVVVAAWEGDLDRAKAKHVLDGEVLVDVTAG